MTTAAAAMLTAVLAAMLAAALAAVLAAAAATRRKGRPTSAAGDRQAQGVSPPSPPCARTHAPCATYLVRSQ
jgi:hypothetical protein